MKYFLSVLSLLFFCIVGQGQTIQPANTATYCVGASVPLTVNGATAGSVFHGKEMADVGTIQISLLRV